MDTDMYIIIEAGFVRSSLDYYFPPATNLKINYLIVHPPLCPPTPSLASLMEKSSNWKTLEEYEVTARGDLPQSGIEELERGMIARKILDARPYFRIASSDSSGQRHDLRSSCSIDPIGDIGITGGRCVFPLVGAARCSSLGCVKERGGGRARSWWCRRLCDEAKERSSVTAVDPPEVLSPLLEWRPSRTRYSSASASFSVLQPCQQLRQSQTRNWKQKVSMPRQGWKQMHRFL